jgi:hypothetical protein
MYTYTYISSWFILWLFARHSFKLFLFFLSLFDAKFVKHECEVFVIILKLIIKVDHSLFVLTYYLFYFYIWLNYWIFLNISNIYIYFFCVNAHTFWNHQFLTTCMGCVNFFGINLSFLLETQANNSFRLELFQEIFS